MDKREILKTIVAHGQAGQWERALDECRRAAMQFPDDPQVRTLLSGLADRLAAVPVPVFEGVASAPASAPAPPHENHAEDTEARTRAFMEEAARRRQERQDGMGDSMAAVMQNSRRISDVLHEATTKHLVEDVEAMLTTVRGYLAQDLLPEALRLCQKIAALEPDNEQMKALLKEVYRRRGL